MDQQELDKKKKRRKFYIAIFVVLYIAIKIACMNAKDTGNLGGIPVDPAFINAISFVPLILIIGFAILMRRTRSLADKLIEPIKSDRVRANVISSSDDKLSIPLEGAVDKLTKDSTLNGSDAGNILAGIFIMALFLLGAYAQAANGKHDKGLFYAVGFAVIILMTGYRIIRRINMAGKLRRFYDGYKTPQLIMDARGLTIPAIMFSYNDKALDYFLKTQNFSLTVGWNDIEAWKSLSMFQNRYIQKMPTPVYMLTVKNLPISGAKTITIKSDLLGEKAQNLIEFARRFLSVPIEEFANPYSAKGGTFANFNILTKILIYVFLGILGIITVVIIAGMLFAPKEKIDMHRPVTYSCEQAMTDFAKKNGADPYNEHELISNDAINDYYITQYIKARESFIGSQPHQNYDNYNLVRVFSLPQVFRDYQQQIILKNPESPGARLGATGSREVNISGIKFLDKHDLPYDEEARRYKVTAHIEERINGALKALDKSIIIEFKYTALDLSMNDRCLNALGVRVLSYEADAINPVP